MLSTMSFMRWLYVGSSSTNPENWVYKPSPNRYKASSAILQTMKLATARGSRSFTNTVTTGSSRNAIVIATTIVMKKTRPKYSNATHAATAIIVRPACTGFGDGIVGAGVGVGVSVDTGPQVLFYDEMKSVRTANKIN